MTEILPIPIADYGDEHSIYVCCDDFRCVHGKSFRPSELLERLGADATFHTILSEAVCSRCGRRPTKISTSWISPDQRGYEV